MKMVIKFITIITSRILTITTIIIQNKESETNQYKLLNNTNIFSDILLNKCFSLKRS